MPTLSLRRTLLCLFALTNSLPAAEMAPREPARLSTEFCVGCHGINLVGGAAPNLLDSIWKNGGDDDSILRSIRGPKGGYQLARPPADVTIADVVACLEGDQSARAAASRDTPEFDVLAALQEQLDQARAAILSGTSLQDLLDQRDQRIQAQAMYFI